MSTDIAIENQSPASGPGAVLRRAREAKGLHISVLATSLRVPVDRIRALESEKWDELPDLVFARALTMSVCRHLKIDSTPVLAGMPDPDPMRSVRVTAALSQPLGGVVTQGSSHRTLWLVLSLLVLSLLAWFMTSAQRDARPTATVEVPGMPPTPAAVPDASVPTESSTPATDSPSNAGATDLGQSSPAQAPASKP